MKTFAGKAAAAAAGLLLALLLAESGLRLLGLAVRHSRAPQAGAGARILCVGDSFTYGIGAPKGESYPDHLQRLLDAAYGTGAYAVVNEGVPGQNSSELAARLDYLLAAHRPAALVVLTGANNYSLRNTNFFLFSPEELTFSGRAALRADSALSHLKVYRLFRFAGKGVLDEFRKLAYSPPRCAPASQQALDQAMKMFEAKDFYGAAAALEAARSKDGACAELSFQAGRMQFYYRDFPKAFDHFRRGRELDPRHPFVKIFLSQEIPLLRPQTAAAALDKLLAYDLGLICGAARSAGAKVLIQTYPFGTDSQRDGARKAAAAGAGAALADQREVFLPLTAGPKFKDYLSGDEPDLMASHPNSKGYRLMAGTVLSAGQKAGVFPPATAKP
jgi:lysophospholipase L1-like esterase